MHHAAREVARSRPGLGCRAQGMRVLAPPHPVPGPERVAETSSIPVRPARSANARVGTFCPTTCPAASQSGPEAADRACRLNSGQTPGCSSDAWASETHLCPGGGPDPKPLPPGRRWPGPAPSCQRWDPERPCGESSPSPDLQAAWSQAGGGGQGPLQTAEPFALSPVPLLMLPRHQGSAGRE